MIRKFDNLHSPAFRYDAEGDLFDSSGNDLHLTASATPIFRRLYGSTLGLVGGCVLNRNGVSDSALRALGDFTINVLLILRATPSSLVIAAYNGSGEAEPTNYIWSLRFDTQNQVAAFTEHGAGLDSTASSNAAIEGLPALNVPFMFTERRKDNVYTFFIDGIPFGKSSALTSAPTGGTSGQLFINPGGSTAFDLFGMEFIASALTDLEIKERYNFTLGEELGYLEDKALSVWTGAVTDTSASAVVRVAYATDSVRIAVTNDGGTSYTPASSVDHGEAARFDLSGLEPDAEYTYQVEVDEFPVPGPIGHFKTFPVGACSFVCAFSGDAGGASSHPVFDAILAQDPLFFIHMGDADYADHSTNDPSLFLKSYDLFLSRPRQSVFYASIPVDYVFDDHDYGVDNSDGTSATKPAATSCYRLRVPHYPLGDNSPNGGVYHSFDVGRVRFVVTDQRSQATPNSATDNASKSMLGSLQKTWFKNILSNSSGMLIVWVCPRWFQGNTSDSWSGFSTERREIADYIKANCHGRVIVLSADMHSLAIDDGTHHDFATGGGEPLPTFQASPLDITPGGSGNYTYGPYLNNGLFGTMEIADAGGSSIGVTWKGYDSTGSAFVSYSFSVNV